MIKKLYDSRLEQIKQDTTQAVSYIQQHFTAQELSDPGVLLPIMAISGEVAQQLFQDQAISDILCSESTMKQVLLGDSDVELIDTYYSSMQQHRPSILRELLKEITLENLLGDPTTRHYPYLRLEGKDMAIMMPFASSSEGICLDNTCKANEEMKEFIRVYLTSVFNLQQDLSEDIALLTICGASQDDQTEMGELLSEKMRIYEHIPHFYDVMKLINDINDFSLIQFPKVLEELFRSPRNNLYAVHLHPDLQDNYMRAIDEMIATKFNHSVAQLFDDELEVANIESPFHQSAKNHFGAIQINQIKDDGASQLNQRLQIILQLGGSSNGRVTKEQFTQVMQMPGMEERLKVELRKVYPDLNETKLYESASSYLNDIVVDNSIGTLLSTIGLVQDEDQGLSRLRWLQETWKNRKDISPFYAVIGESSPYDGTISSADANQLSLVTQFFIGTVNIVLRGNGHQVDIGQELEHNESLREDLLSQLTAWVQAGQNIESQLYEWVARQFDQDNQFLQKINKEAVIDMFKKRYKTVSAIHEFDEFYQLYGSGIWREKNGRIDCNIYQQWACKALAEDNTIKKVILDPGLRIFFDKLQYILLSHQRFEEVLEFIQKELPTYDASNQEESLPQALKSLCSATASPNEIEYGVSFVMSVLRVKDTINAQEYGSSQKAAIDFRKLIQTESANNFIWNMAMAKNKALFESSVARQTEEGMPPELSELVKQKSRREMELQALTEIKNNQIKPETRDLMKNHQIDVNCLDEANKTALYIAVERGYEGIAKWLIEQGASVKEKWYLHKALANNDENMVALLLPKYDREHFSNDMVYLMTAVRARNHKIIQWLLDAGAKPNTRNERLEGPIDYAVDAGDITTVKMLLEAGENINKVDKDGKTLLEKALDHLSKSSDAGLVLELINAGVNTEGVGRYIMTNANALLGMTSSQDLIGLIYDPPFVEYVKHHAFSEDQLQIMRKMGPQSATRSVTLNVDTTMDRTITLYDLNQTNSIGQTALLRAIETGNDNAALQLLSCPSMDVNHEDESGETPLIAAIKNGRTEVLRALLGRQDLLVNRKNRFGSTELTVIFEDRKSHQQFNDGTNQCIEAYLSDPRVDPNIKSDQSGHLTAFEWACERGEVPMLSALLRCERTHITTEAGGVTPMERLRRSPASFDEISEVSKLLDMRKQSDSGINTMEEAAREVSIPSAKSRLGENARKESYNAGHRAQQCVDTIRNTDSSMDSSINDHQSKHPDKGMGDD